MVVLDFQEWFLDLMLVDLSTVLDDDSCDFWEIVHDGVPVGFSDAVTAAVCLTLVNKHCSHIVTTIVCSNHYAIFIPNDVLFLLVDFITNVNPAVRNKDYLAHFLKLFKQNMALLFHSWLEISQDFHHEFSVLLVIPGELLLNILCSS